MAKIIETIEGKRFPFDLPRYGVWSIEPGPCIARFNGMDGTERDQPVDVELTDLFVDLLGLPGSGYGVAIPRGARRAYRLDGHNGTVEPLLDLARESLRDKGLAFVRFLVSMTNVLIVYESGVLCLDAAARVVWQRAGHQLDWHFERLDEDKIIFSSEHRDEWAYDVKSGEDINAVG